MFYYFVLFSGPTVLLVLCWSLLKHRSILSGKREDVLCARANLESTESRRSGLVDRLFDVAERFVVVEANSLRRHRQSLTEQSAPHPNVAALQFARELIVIMNGDPTIRSDAHFIFVMNQMVAVEKDIQVHVVDANLAISSYNKQRTGSFFSRLASEFFQFEAAIYVRPSAATQFLTAVAPQAFQSSPLMN